MARPKLDIDPQEVFKLAQIQCTVKEIACFFECDESTIRERFPQELAKGREAGKISLRRKQMAVAMNGNVSMLIWLGKQFLEQREPQSNQTNVIAQLGPTITYSNDQLIELAKKAIETGTPS